MGYLSDMLKIYNELNKKALNEDQEEYEGSFRQFVDNSFEAVFPNVLKSKGKEINVT